MDEIYYDESRYRFDDLQNKGLKLCQDKTGFCFGLDAVLLADFAAAGIKPNSTVAELCSGNGIVSLLLWARTRTPHITAVEINENAAGLAAFNVRNNHIEDSVTVVCDDVKRFAGSSAGKFDAVVVNPPYIAVGRGEMSSRDGVGEARHELSLTLDELCAAASRLLHDRGRFFMVHRALRISEILAKLSAHRLEAKQLRFVQPRAEQNANLVLVYGVKGGGVGCTVLPSLVVYDESGSYSAEIEKIYNRDNVNGRI